MHHILVLALHFAAAAEFEGEELLLNLPVGLGVVLRREALELHEEVRFLPGDFLFEEAVEYVAGVAVELLVGAGGDGGDGEFCNEGVDGFGGVGANGVDPGGSGVRGDGGGCPDDSLGDAAVSPVAVVHGG